MLSSDMTPIYTFKKENQYVYMIRSRLLYVKENLTNFYSNTNRNFLIKRDKNILIITKTNNNILSQISQVGFKEDKMYTDLTTTS